MNPSPWEGAGDDAAQARPPWFCPPEPSDHLPVPPAAPAWGPPPPDPVWYGRLPAYGWTPPFSDPDDAVLDAAWPMGPAYARSRPRPTAEDGFTVIGIILGVIAVIAGLAVIGIVIAFVIGLSQWGNNK